MSQAISSAILAIPLPPVRRAVLLALEQGDRNESDIAVFLCRTVRTTRKHLKELEGMGLVACRQSEPSGKMYTLTIGGDRV